MYRGFENSNEILFILTAYNKERNIEKGCADHRFNYFTIHF